MLHIPASETELLEILARYPVQAFWAGTTDLMVAFQRGLMPWSEEVHHVSLHRLPWTEIRVHQDALELGARVTVSQLLTSSLVGTLAPVLQAAARVFGSPAIRNRATVAGNLANASPAADLWPPLLVLNASVVLLSPEGTREVPLRSFYTGYRQTVRNPHEVIRWIRIPADSLELPYYHRKVGLRQSQAIAVVSLAAVKAANGEIRLSAGAVNPVVTRLEAVEMLVNAGDTDPRALRQALTQDIHPITDLRATAHYRLETTLRLLLEALEVLRDA